MSDESENDIENEQISENVNNKEIIRGLNAESPIQIASSSKSNLSHEGKSEVVSEIGASYGIVKGSGSTAASSKATSKSHSYKSELEINTENRGVISEHSIAILQKMEEDEFLMKLVAYEDLPDWLKDNEYLRHGYRHQIKSVSACFKTICSRHTETGNIWTHLIGTLMFFIFMVSFAYTYLGQVPFLDYIVVLFFFGSAIMCFGLSTLYHTLSCHSEPIILAFAQLDYFGINLLITGSQVPWLYFAFYCRKRLRNLYLALLLLASVLIALCSLYEKFGEVNNRWIRSTIFGIFAFSGLFPIFHMLFLDGWTVGYYQASLGWLGLMIFAYLLGGMLYTSRFPERVRPGTFDIFLHSHQLMHVMTVIGTYVYMQAVYDMLLYRQQVGECHYE